jgi:hypothetical protein
METLRIKGFILVLAEGIAALSMWMGFRLFELGITDKADGVAEFGSAKFWLTGGGPGLFFAAFGAAITVFAITRQFSYERDESASGDDKTVISSFMGLTSGDYSGKPIARVAIDDPPLPARRTVVRAAKPAPAKPAPAKPKRVVVKRVVVKAAAKKR